MVPLTSLILPIVVSALVVFFASFIMHAVLGYHKQICASCQTRRKTRSSQSCSVSTFRRRITVCRIPDRPRA